MYDPLKVHIQMDTKMNKSQFPTNFLYRMWHCLSGDLIGKSHYAYAKNNLNTLF